MPADRSSSEIARLLKILKRLEEGARDGSIAREPCCEQDDVAHRPAKPASLDQVTNPIGARIATAMRKHRGQR
jgi:hypothetical protein